MSNNPELDALFARAKKFHAVLSKCAIVSTPAGWYKIAIVLDPAWYGAQGIEHHEGVYVEPYDDGQEDYILDPEVDFNPENFSTFTWKDFIDQFDRAKGAIQFLAVHQVSVEE